MGIIYNFLKENKAKKIYPFNMPGHKGNNSFFENIDFLSMDITEIEGADNLRNPNGIIEEAQNKIAACYKAYKSFMLVNGSTVGILAAMLYGAKDGEEIILARNSHVSAYSGLALSGAMPHFIYPCVTPYGFFGGIDPNKIESEIKKHPHVKAVFITNPTYEGVCSDVTAISKITKKYGKILIVDEAHGAHLGFHSYFPKSAITLGADIVIQSFHKTLPVFNQGAVIHISKNIDENIMKNCINYVQTTSPSYILLAQIENAVDYLNDTKLMENYVLMLRWIRDYFENNDEIKLLPLNLNENYCIKELDPGKLVFFVNTGKINASDFYMYMLNDCDIQMEMKGLRHILAMTSVCDTKEGFEKLAKSIKNLDNNLKFCEDNNKIYKNFTFFENEPVFIISPRKACFSPKIYVKIKYSTNRIAGDFIITYPPGIPLLSPGELITEEVIGYIIDNINNKLDVIGIKDGYIAVIS